MTKGKALYTACIILPLVASIILFVLLPGRIPAHASITGVIDRYGNKAEIFIVPVASAIGLLGFKAFFSYVAKKTLSRNANAGPKTVEVASVAVALTFFGLCVWYFIWLLMNVRL